MPAELPDVEADEAQFEHTDPWVDAPLQCDYGYNIKISPTAYVNANSTFIDTCEVYIGPRVLVGPNCSFYSGRHPLDPAVRNGLKGPETGQPIWIEEDAWLGGGVTILSGVRVGRGAVCGAGSVVTKDVPPFHLVAGNPARIIRKIESAWDTQNTGAAAENPMESTGTAMAEHAAKIEQLEGRSSS